MGGVTGKFGRRLSLALVAGAALTAAIPASTSAATTIGQTFDPRTGGTPGLTNLQSASPGGQYAAPAAGVITSWSYQSGIDPTEIPDQIRLKVARPAGFDLFTIVGQSDPAVPVVSALNTYPTHIPVQAGDVIGFWFSNDRNVGSGRAAPGYALHYAPGDIPPGSTTAFTPFDATQLDLSATVETTPCGGQPPTIPGTAGNDTLIGTDGPDVIVGLGGQDTLKGAAGKDRICGGDGKDTLRGGKGKDKLLGQNGADTLGGGGGNDSCRGGKGDDALKSC